MNIPVKKKASRKEGLLNFYCCYIHNDANLPVGCFFVRFVCFFIIIIVTRHKLLLTEEQK
jgi:hypothetical protein